MRAVKAKINVPKRYYRPELTRCPHCHWKVKRGSKLWHIQINRRTIFPRSQIDPTTLTTTPFIVNVAPVYPPLQ
jgi:hypothetical protein